MRSSFGWKLTAVCANELPGRWLPIRGWGRSRRLAIGLIGSVATVLTLFVAAAPMAQAAPPASKTSFVVSGLTSAAAGTVQTVTVTALINGQPSPGYRGTVV